MAMPFRRKIAFTGYDIAIAASRTVAFSRCLLITGTVSYIAENGTNALASPAVSLSIKR